MLQISPLRTTMIQLWRLFEFVALKPIAKESNSIKEGLDSVCKRSNQLTFYG